MHSVTCIKAAVIYELSGKSAYYYSSMDDRKGEKQLINVIYTSG